MMMSLHAMVREAALKHGTKTAVRLDSGSSATSLTFQELLDSADELSTKLQRALGQREDMIGLYCHVNILLPAWLCGVLQMPAAYVPFDPISPPQLTMRVMDRCDLKFCLIQSSLLQHFRSVFSSFLCVQMCAEWPALNLTLVKMDRRALTPSEASKTEGPRAEDNPVLQAEEDPNSHLNAGVSGASQQTEQLAYVLHTSGTTGLPKIVKVPHKCIVPNIIHFRSLFQITPDDIIFLGSPLTFDPSVVEMFLALSSGACLLMVPTAVKRMPGKLAHVLFRRNTTTVLQVTPTLVRRFGGRVLQEQVLSAGSSLRVLALGGEVCPSSSILRSWRQEGNKTRIYNLYGTTEVSCWACCFEVPDSVLSSGCLASSSVPLGEPLMDTVVEVRDERGCVVTEGEGQVFIGGQERVCLLDNEMTPIRGVMRATGDWVIVQKSHLYYLGRKDRLIKRHGQPVQLDALQQAIESLPQVEAAVVGLHEGGRLVAFVVPVIARRTNNSSVVSVNQDLDVQNVTDGSPIDSSFSRSLEMEVLQGLSQLVSSHSIPDTVILVPALPLTNHGKVAMQKLMRLYERQREVSSNHTALEDIETVRERLQTLWKECLGLSDDGEVTEDAQFMLIGGDSLQALRLYDYLVLTMGTVSEGLLEVILDGTFSDVLKHLTTATQHSTAETPAKRQHEDSASVSCKKNNTEVTSKVESEHLVVRSEKTMGFVVVRRAGEVVEWHYSQSTKQLTESKTDPTQDLSKESYPEVEFRTSQHENNSSGTPTGLYPANITSIKIGTSSGNVQDQDCGSCATLPSDNQPLTLQVSWSSDTGRCVDASPVLLVGPKQSTVFIGSHSNRFQALDLNTGDVVWERVLGDRLESSAALSKCGSLVAVGCYDGQVYFLWVNSGETHWMYKTGDAVKSSPTVDPQTGLVIVGSHDGYVYALNPVAKFCVWKQYCGAGAVFSSPCIHSSPRQLYCATLRGQLHCLNPDSGNLLWTYSSDFPFFSSPSCSDSCVCIGSVNGCISAFNHNGHMLWNFLTDGPVFSSPSLASFPPPANKTSTSSYDSGTTLTSASQVVVCGSHDCSVYCLNSTNGSLLWRFRTTGKVYSSPFVFNGTPWGVRTLVAVASADGTVWILDGEHGTLKASLTLRGELFSSPVVWGRTVVVGCRNDYVYCLELLQNKQIVKTAISEP